MNDESKKQTIAEIYALFRAKYIYFERLIEQLGLKDISEQCHVVLDAIAEAKKFECFIEISAWPAELTTGHEYLLHTKKLYKEIKTHAGILSQICYGS